ncbi:MAG TPA: caspase family protein [Polyangiaceae bacterium]
MTLRVLGLALAFLLCSPPAWGAVHRFAVIAGSNQGGADDATLRYAESDARKVAEVLRDIGGFDAANLTLLLGESADSLRRTLITVNDRIRAAQSLPDTETVLFVYFSGHADAQGLRLGRSRFDLTELAQLVRGSSGTFRLLVLDACRSGVLTRAKGGRPVAAFDVNRSAGLGGQGLAFLTASSANEDAQESDQLRGSFFTHALVSGLLGAADLDHDRTVVLEEAYRYAYDATLRATSRTFAGTQHPTFAFEMRGQESLVLTRLEPANATRSVLSLPSGTEFLILRDHENGPVIAEVLATGGQRRLSLRPGRYFVRGRGKDVLFEGAFALAAGANVNVDLARLERVEYARLVRKGTGDRRVAHGPDAGAIVRSRLPNAGHACWGAVVGYHFDFSSVTLAPRASFCASGFENAAVEATTHEYALTVAVEHAWDLSWSTFALGGGAGAAITHQRFATQGSAPDRVGTAPLAFLSTRIARNVTSSLFASLELRAEGHLMELQERATLPAELQLEFAGRASAGMGAEF